MPQRNVTLTNEVGLHARPAALFVKAAGQFDAGVTITKGESSANGKSLLSLLKLDVRQGDAITIATDGEDAHDALDALVETIEAL